MTEKAQWNWKRESSAPAHPQKFANVPGGELFNSSGHGNNLLGQGYYYGRLLWNVVAVLALPIIWYLVTDGIIHGTGMTYNSVVTAIANPMSMNSYAMNPVITFMFIAIYVNAGVVLLLRFGWGATLENSEFMNSPMPGFRYGLILGSVIAIAYQQVWSAFGLMTGALLTCLWSNWYFPVKHAVTHVGKNGEESRAAWFAPFHRTSILEYVPQKLEQSITLIYVGLSVCGLFIGAFVITAGGWPLSISVDNLSITLLVLFAVLSWVLNSGYCLDTIFTVILGFTFLSLSVYMKNDPTVGKAVFGTTGGLGGATLLISLMVAFMSMRRLRAAVVKQALHVFPPLSR